MLRTAKTLKGYTLDCPDGELGRATDFFFDDQHWAVRYLVADTGNWLMGRQVLLSPHALIAVLQEERQIVVALTKDQIENSPPLESDKPVSRQFEEAYYGYYGWPMYWEGSFMWGAYPSVVRDREELVESARKQKAWDPHLRSARAVAGYHIQANDGEIGHVDDFIIDDETWAIRYLVIDTQNWWPGKKVLVSPLWIERVSWCEAKVFINLFRETVRESPEYTDLPMLTREYEAELHRHYNRQGYWATDPIALVHTQ